MKFSATAAAAFFVVLASSATPATNAFTNNVVVVGVSKSTAVIHASTTTHLSSTAEPIAEPAASTGPKAKIPQRVVVTGLGVVNGCGIGHEAFFQACLDGKSSIDRVQRFDISHMPCQIGSECRDFDAKEWFTNQKNVKSNDRYTHLAVAAARQALRDAGMGDTPETLPNPESIGVMVGTAFGGMETFEQQTLKLASNPEKPKVRCTKCGIGTRKICLILGLLESIDRLRRSLSLYQKR